MRDFGRRRSVYREERGGTESRNGWKRVNEKSFEASSGDHG